MIKFTYTILYVENVTATIEFYEKAFGFQRKFITAENDYGELITGETTLSFASLTLGKANFENGFDPSTLHRQPFGIELAFTSDNCEADYENAIAAGAIAYEPLKEKPWGQKVGYIRDINGFLIEICSPLTH
jgi:lactoylglutathione lyase